jgi:hypothetical protein
MKSWATEKGMSSAYVLPRHEQFLNYWHAKAGKDASKLDWVLTWRNWMLKDHAPGANVHPVDFGGKPVQPKKPTDDLRRMWKS